MTRTFPDVFGRPADVHAEAPGRVNLIGEHTDYNDGFVLPTVIPLVTRVELARRPDRRAVVMTLEPEPRTAEFVVGAESQRGDWLDYVMGLTQQLANFGELGGFDALIRSGVPWGAGLSSSAALLVALGRALRSTFGLSADEVALAMACHRAEREFVGAPVGIMDPMACALAEPGYALFLDARTARYREVEIPASDLVVIDSGVAHRHAAGGYAQRRAECEAAARAMGVASLRDVADLHAVSRLPAPLDKRARHVLTENDRVHACVVAFEAGDLQLIGPLFAASHESMRLDFEITVPEVDALVETAREDSDVFGVRMTGGGFGGAVVALCRAGSGFDVSQRICERTARRGVAGARTMVTGRVAA